MYSRPSPQKNRKGGEGRLYTGYVKVIKKSGGLNATEYLILTNFYVICDLQLNRHTENGFVHVTKKDAYKAMFMLLDSFCAGRETIPGRASVHT